MILSYRSPFLPTGFVRGCFGLITIAFIALFVPLSFSYAKTNLWGNTITIGMTPLIGDQLKAVQSICSDVQSISTNPISCHINLMPARDSVVISRLQPINDDITIYQGDDTPAVGYFVATIAYKTAYLLAPKDSSVRSIQDLKGKKIVSLRTLGDTSLHNILEASGVNSQGAVLNSVGPTSVSACHTFDDVYVFYLGMPDDLLTYDLINSCNLRPVPIDMVKDSAFEKNLKAAYPYYRPTILDGATFGQSWGKVPSIMVPFVMIAVPTVYDYKVGILLQAFLEKSVPRSKFFLTVGPKPTDYLKNITPLPDHQATKRVRGLVKGAPHG